LFVCDATGASSQHEVVSSCVGQTFDYNCTLNTNLHIWDIPKFAIRESLSLGVPSTTEGMFTFRVVDSITIKGNTTIITSLTVVTFDQLNGTKISCLDGLAAVGEGETEYNCCGNR